MQRRVALLSVLLLSGCAGEATEAPPVLALENVTVIDGTGADPRRGVTVVIRRDRIETVAPAAAVGLPSHARVLDGRGAFVIPGLWDMHTHALWNPLARETFLPLYVAQGVTGVRDMGGTLEELKAFREDLATGSPVAPRVFAAGRILDGPQPLNPSISEAVGTAAEARRAVRDLAGAGVDFIKVYTLLPRDAFFAAVEEAERHGLKVAGHVPANVSAVEMADAGVASIEHMQSETGGFCRPEEPATCAAVFQAFRRNRTWQVPTLAVRRARAFADDPALAADPRLEFVVSQARDDWQAERDRKLSARPPAYFEQIKEQFRTELRLAGALHEAGIPLLAGSDAGAFFSLPGFSLHDELGLLVEAGLSPMESLEAASRNAAEFLGLSEELGTIEEGKVADLVLLDANPLDDIANTRRIRAVVQAGRLWQRSDLDAILDRVRRTVLEDSQERKAAGGG